MTIPTRQIGRTGLAVPELGFGAASLGNLYKPVTNADAGATLDAALAAGMAYVDTAPHYGRGLSERRVGDGLRGRTGVVLSTKVGRLMQPDSTVTDDREREGFFTNMPFARHYDYSHDGILRSFEASIQRLGLARVDLLYVHDIGTLTHGAENAHYWAQLTTGGGFRALEHLREEGVIAGFGLGVNEVAVCREAMRVVQLDAILLAGRYTLLEQTPLDDLLPECAAAETSIVIGGPYNSGILATGTRTAGVVHYDYGPAPESVVARVRGIEAVCDRYGIALPAAALHFVLAHPQVASVIPGQGSPKRIAATVALHATPIPWDFWAELKAEGLVRSDAPVPTP
jgi:D-threo-aldose 1-dehydrogenase